MKFSITHTSISRWRVALLVLLFAAGSQVVLAGHQFQHDDLLVSESCAICAQVEQQDVPLPAAVHHIFTAPLALPSCAWQQSGDGTGLVVHYRGRAPPVR